MKISSSLRHLHSSKQHGFYMGGSRSLEVCLKDPLSGELGGQTSGDGSLVIYPRVRVRA